MKLKFTKMHGTGNDFIVLDATAAPLELDAQQCRALGDRRFGVGADQILIVENSRTPGVDFRYRIFNNNGAEVEQCGNGARCFVRYVIDKGLSRKTTLRVETINSLIELHLQADGRVTVDMGPPIVNLSAVPFDAGDAKPRQVGDCELWPLDLAFPAGLPPSKVEARVEVAVLSMGNPHAVQLVPDVDSAPVQDMGPLIEHDVHFPRQVNAGFMQVLTRNHIKLRVFERGAGETLACGTGACAAVVAGIRLGLLDSPVEVTMRGGAVSVEWAGGTDSVFMTGPAVSVFEGEIEL